MISIKSQSIKKDIPVGTIEPMLKLPDEMLADRSKGVYYGSYITVCSPACATTKSAFLFIDTEEKPGGGGDETYLSFVNKETIIRNQTEYIIGSPITYFLA